MDNKGAYPADGGESNVGINPSSPPPEYTPNLATVERHDTNVPPPPSYESIFKKATRCKEESKSNVEFGQKCWGMTNDSYGCHFLHSMSIGLPLASLINGAMRIYECPAQRMIPIYLVVYGCFGIAAFILGIARRVAKRKEECKEKGKPWGVETAVNTFLFAWFICGNVWVFNTYGKFQSDDTTASNYCHNTLYYFAFWTIIGIYIVVGLFIIACCLICGCACKAAKKK